MFDLSDPMHQAVLTVLVLAVAYFIVGPLVSAADSTPLPPPMVVTGGQTKEEEMDAKGIRYFTAAEVARHNKPDDCWIIVDGKVYDVTPYVEQHVGGEDAITRYAGQDNTKPFHGDQHPLKVREVIDEFYLGRLKTDDKADASASESESQAQKKKK